MLSNPGQASTLHFQQHDTLAHKDNYRRSQCRSEANIDWPSPDESPPFWERLPRSDQADQLATHQGGHRPIKESPNLDRKTLNVVHVTAEMAPIAKVCSYPSSGRRHKISLFLHQDCYILLSFQVGGLGDVVTGLSRACIARGHAVEVILPYYQCIPDDAVEDLRHYMDFECPKAKFWDGHWQDCSLKTSAWKGKIAGEYCTRSSKFIGWSPELTHHR